MLSKVLSGQHCLSLLPRIQCYKIITYQLHRNPRVRVNTANKTTTKTLDMNLLDAPNEKALCKKSVGVFDFNIHVFEKHCILFTLFKKSMLFSRCTKHLTKRRFKMLIYNTTAIMCIMNSCIC